MELGNAELPVSEAFGSKFSCLLVNMTRPYLPSEGREEKKNSTQGDSSESVLFEPPNLLSATNGKNGRQTSSNVLF